MNVHCVCVSMVLVGFWCRSGVGRDARVHVPRGEGDEEGAGACVDVQYVLSSPQSPPIHPSTDDVDYV